MAKTFEKIDAKLSEWIAQQRLFFVASAPLAREGHINCSPKGGDSFRVLDDLTVAYQDLTGSGAETIAHLRENGRVVIMFCAFDGPPRIVRLHGTGEAITPDHADFAALAARFPPHLGTRAFIRVRVGRISDSCGYAVPLYDYRGDRDILDKWTETKGPDKIKEYQRTKNTRSLDNLPALDEN